MNYAGYGQRLIAALLDGLIVGVTNFMIGIVIGVVTGGDQNGTVSTLSYLIGLGVSVGYFVFYQAEQGQTVGKRVMGIRVVGVNGKTPTPMTFFLREIIGKTISAFILFIGYLMPLWDGRKQALHDKIANTFVVKV